MNRTGHHRTGESPRSGRGLALFGVLFLWLLAVPAQALVVTIDLGWGYNSAGGLDNASLISGYNLQEGSIVQVIMYNSATASAPGANAINNFEVGGQYSGYGISAEPWAAIPPAHTPGGTLPAPYGDTTIYDPYTIVESGHVMAYTTHIGPAIGGNAYGQNWYDIYAQFEILGTYDRLYIRVFGATDFSSMDVVSSYWGLSAVQNGTNIIDTWYVNPIDDVVASRTNYFEVIPEPGSLALLVLGGAGLLAGRRRRPKTSSAE